MRFIKRFNLTTWNYKALFITIGIHCFVCLQQNDMVSVHIQMQILTTCQCYMRIQLLERKFMVKVFLSEQSKKLSAITYIEDEKCCGETKRNTITMRV